MKFYSNDIYVLIVSLSITLTLFVSCTVKKIEPNYLTVDLNSWEEYLSQELSYQNPINHTLILISRPTFCGDCLKELKKWNEYLDNRNNNLEIILIVVDRYRTNAEDFIQKNDFDFDFLVDTQAVILDKELIPSIPSKVYFRNDEVQIIDRIGDKTSFEKILILSKREGSSEANTSERVLSKVSK